MSGDVIVIASLIEFCIYWTNKNLQLKLVHFMVKDVDPHSHWLIQEMINYQQKFLDYSTQWNFLEEREIFDA